MKQYEAIRAYKALQKLENQLLPIRTARAIHRMMVSIRPAWEFQKAEEEKILRRLRPEALPDGKLKFKTPEEARAFRDRMEELDNLDAEGADTAPLQIPLPEDAFLAASDIEALEGFIQFTGE